MKSIKPLNIGLLHAGLKAIKLYKYELQENFIKTKSLAKYIEKSKTMILYLSEFV